MLLGSLNVTGSFTLGFFLAKKPFSADQVGTAEWATPHNTANGEANVGYHSTSFNLYYLRLCFICRPWQALAMVNTIRNES